MNDFKWIGSIEIEDNVLYLTAENGSVVCYPVDTAEDVSYFIKRYFETYYDL